jgi:hypothetical protein
MLRQRDQHPVQELFRNRLDKDVDNLKNKVALSPVAIEKFWLATNNEHNSRVTV